MLDCLPEEILIQVLARLPVKLLLKFRCVSKSWKSLISGPDFMNTHLNLHKNNNFSLFEYDWPVHLNSLNHEDSTLDLDTSGFIGLGINGFCNGLLCLSDYPNTTIILWNPSVKKSVTLPTPNIIRPKPVTICVVGFGFDYRVNDYKVVRLQYMCQNYPPEVELCELSKGTWRRLACTVPTYISSSYRYKSQAYINGVVHWIALDHRGVNGPCNLIAAFDMIDEVFHEMALPDKIADGFVVNMSIGIFEESLMVVVYHPSKNCTVWVMKEYGVAKSWVNQFNLNLGVGGLPIVQSLMKNSKLSLETTSKQLILDQQIKVVQFYSPSTLSLYVGTYMESLVLLKGRQIDSCDAVTSKRKEDEKEEQQCPTMLEEAKTTKKTWFEIGHWSGI